jgi:hypothetical protein
VGVPQNDTWTERGRKEGTESTGQSREMTVIMVGYLSVWHDTKAVCP